MLLTSLVLTGAGALAEDSYRVRVRAADVEALVGELEGRGWDVAGHHHAKGLVDMIVDSPAAVDAIADEKDPRLAFDVLEVERARPLRESRVSPDLQGDEDDLEGYYDTDKTEQALRDLAAAHPDVAKVWDLSEWLGVPKTVDGRSLLALQVSRNPGELEDEPKVIMIAQHHAREITTQHTVLDAAAEILERAKGGDATVKGWIEKSAIWFVPAVNPDGLQYVFEHNNMWRKNRARNADGSRGVDLNRNYDFKWGRCGTNSTQGSSEVFRGPRALSEVEVQTMDKLNEKLRAQYILSFHSYGDEVLAPYLCGTMAERAVYYDIRDRLATTLGYGKRPASSSGEDFEHHYARYGTISFLLEMGDQFQPSFQTYRSTLWPTVQKALPFVMNELHRAHVRIRVREAGSGRSLQPTLTVREIQFREGERRIADAFGSYRWRLAPGSYALTATLPGYRAATVPVQVTGGVQDVTVELSPDDDARLRLDRWLWDSVRNAL